MNMTDVWANVSHSTYSRNRPSIVHNRLSLSWLGLLPLPHSWGTAIGHASGSFIEMSPAPVLSRPPADSTQILQNPFPTVDNHLHPRCPFKLVTSIV